jgi:hypothetical protein
MIRTVKAIADIASNAPSPATDRVMVENAPSATPATSGRALRRPTRSDWPITSRQVGPGIASMAAVARAKAIQVS